MSTTGRTAVAVVDHGADVRELEAALPPGVSLRVVPLSEGRERVLATITSAGPEVVFVSCENISEDAISVIQAARAHRPGAAVLVVQSGNPNGSMERAFEAGADDLIRLPQPEGGLAFAIKKAVARRRGAVPSGLGAIICIVGPKGGTGKTLTACNLAVALAAAGEKTALVDVDLQFGDVGISLGLPPERTIYDLALSPGELDVDKVVRHLIKHPSGVDALLAPVRPDQASAVTVPLLREVFALLRGSYDYVVLDTPPAFSPEVIASIDCATDLCVVGMLDALSLKDTKVGLETLGLMGHDVGTVRLVLNRADTSVGISQSDVTTILGRAPDVSIPSSRTIPRAITEGIPILIADPASGPARAFVELAKLYLGEQPWKDGGARADRGRIKLFRKG